MTPGSGQDSASTPGLPAPVAGSRARLGAIILSGGRASRMGGVDKTALTVAGRSLLSRTVRAAGAVCDGTVVVVGAPPVDPAAGHELVDSEPNAGSIPLEAASADADTSLILRSGPSHLVVMREEPAGGGPVAAIAAAIGRVDADEVLLLAGDLAAGDRAVPPVALCTDSDAGARRRCRATDRAGGCADERPVRRPAMSVSAGYNWGDDRRRHVAGSLPCPVSRVRSQHERPHPSARSTR